MTQLIRYTCTLLLLSLSLLPGFAAAQSGSGQSLTDDLLRKCDPWLKHHLLLESARQVEPEIDDRAASSQQWLTLFVSGDRAVMPELIASLGGRTGSFAGTIATVRIPRSSLRALAAHSAIARLELAMPVAVDQDSTRAHVHADQAHAGQGPLQQEVNGKGVIVGVIDTGIDFHHPEFLNADGSTRILSIWSQADTTGNTPEDLGYGSEWSREQIDEDLQGGAQVHQADRRGHGTHVAGIAAGRKGIAPRADIIMVQRNPGIITDQGLTTAVLDGAAYIFARATAEGKPCVINASLGTNEHFHDGSDAMSRGLEALMSESPGRLFVASAGNRGENKGHWGGFAAEQDSLWTFVESGKTGIRIADSNETSFEISIQVDSFDYRGVWVGGVGQTAWRTVREIAAGAGFVDYISIGTIAISAASLDNGHTGIVISSGGPPGGVLFRLMVRGRGIFNAWNGAFSHNPPRAALNDRFRANDNSMMVGSPGIGAMVITVGSYVNRASYMTQDQGSYPNPPMVSGARSTFSSIGPRSDGIIKPDITAPGENVISARSSTLDWAVSGLLLLTDPRYIPFSGTSMSAPVVAGAVALYLQLRPDATVDEVRSAIYSSALRDIQTADAGPLPNGKWGMGKLDIFRMLIGLTTHVPAPSPAMLPVSVIWSRPSPSSGLVAIGRDGSMRGEGRLLVYNVMGEQVASYMVPAGAAEVSVDVADWSAGTYYCRMITSQGMATGRIVVQK